MWNLHWFFLSAHNILWVVMADNESTSMTWRCSWKPYDPHSRKPWPGGSLGLKLILPHATVGNVAGFWPEWPPFLVAVEYGWMDTVTFWWYVNYILYIVYMDQTKNRATLWQTNIAGWNGWTWIENVFPENMGIFQPAMLVYQRVYISITSSNNNYQSYQHLH